MQTFLRILKYADNLTPKLVQFFIYSFLGIIFSAISLVSVSPMLNILFDKVRPAAVPTFPTFSLSVQYPLDVFRYHFISIIDQYGKGDALLFVCLCIVAAVMIGNLFRYLERIIEVASLLEFPESYLQELKGHRPR